MFHIVIVKDDEHPINADQYCVTATSEAATVRTDSTVVERRLQNRTIRLCYGSMARLITSNHLLDCQKMVVQEVFSLNSAKMVNLKHVSKINNFGTSKP